jgi:pyruvate formate lyase activating enzyme
VLRDWHRIDDYRLLPDGRCPDCGTVIPGRFERFSGAFGARRIPLRIRP